MLSTLALPLRQLQSNRYCHHRNLLICQQQISSYLKHKTRKRQRKNVRWFTSYDQEELHSFSQQGRMLSLGTWNNSERMLGGGEARRGGRCSQHSLTLCILGKPTVHHACGKACESNQNRQHPYRCFARSCQRKHPSNLNLSFPIAPRSTRHHSVGLIYPQGTYLVKGHKRKKGQSQFSPRKSCYFKIISEYKKNIHPHSKSL